MNSMFYVNAISSWLRKDQATKLSMPDAKDALGAYPKIQKKFFKDLVENCGNHNQYLVEQGILQVFNHAQQELVPHEWIFLWVVDFRDRQYQMLIQRPSNEEGKGIIASIMPEPFLEFIKTDENALPAVLTLINSPDKIKGALLLVSQQPSAADQFKGPKMTQDMKDFAAWVDVLKKTPNKAGQWFPSFSPKCPVCNEMMNDLNGYEVGFGQLVCPRCGFQMKKEKDYKL